MAKPTPWKDQYTLLCESCGYILEGLDQSLPCPECGKPITESLPERRVGTPWQQHQSHRNLFKTWRMTLCHPIHTLDVITIDGRITNHQTVRTLIWTSVFSGCLVTTLNLVYMPLMNYLIIILTLIFFPILSFIIGLACIGIAYALSTIEYTGLKLIGKSRGYRITSNSAWAIVNHGSVGWLLLGLPLSLTLFLTYHSYALQNLEYLATSSELATIQLFDTLSKLVLYIFCPIGFLFFETFAYLGLRRCKYANTLPPEPAPVYTFSNEPTPQP